MRVVPEAIVCLDTGVWIKFLVPEHPAELSAAAAQLVLRVLTRERLIAPAFAWAELGSVLRKKVRQGLLQPEEAESLWNRFGQLPIEFIDAPEVRVRAWRIAEEYGLLTLYDAAFLACTELAPAPSGAAREFWTVDQELVRSLEASPPAYVRQLQANVGG